MKSVLRYKFQQLRAIEKVPAKETCRLSLTVQIKFNQEDNAQNTLVIKRHED